MITHFEQLLDKVIHGTPQRIAVAVAQDTDVLSSVCTAYQKGIIKGAFLVGDKTQILRIAQDNKFDLSAFEIVNEPEKQTACKAAIKLVRDGEAGLPMKGFVDTPIVLKALLDKDHGLRTGKLITHVGVLEVAGFDRMFILSDSAMTIAPTLENKVNLINNCVVVARALDNMNPKVAILCAVEKENPQMPCTQDAVKLTEMNENSQITGCIVKGPLALDNAVSVAAAEHKGIIHPVAGYADILITPDIEAGNILNKSMEYFAHAEKAGVLMGARKPMILTSRASSNLSKMHSIALGILITQYLYQMENK